MTKARRCAVYTRKSTEEGLEQGFNSLHAQREACEAYITSQRQEGWRVIDTPYDDGGFSGGTLERPALQALLADIRARKVDVVVVYKVDRLTRALADFAKIVEVLDAHGASFVSVTQAFNTTTSMGRLTLNVLLSFAQFEREVTGERIRDKITASKKKGMWMGGLVPLGYEAKERTLAINDDEARTVRQVYDLYLKLGNVRQVKAEADRLGLTSKRRVDRNGKVRGGCPLSRGYIYTLLSNPVYIGKIAHRGRVYEGRHPAIIDAGTWSAVQARLQANGAARQRGSNAKEPSLLAGLLYDHNGRRLSPSHACKAGKRYRYYVSRALITEAGAATASGYRIPAGAIETAVVTRLKVVLQDRQALPALLGLDDEVAPASLTALRAASAHLAASLDVAAGAELRGLLLDLVGRIVVTPGGLDIELRRQALRQRLNVEDLVDDDGMKPDDVYTISLPFQRSHANNGTKILIDDAAAISEQRAPDPSLVKAIVRGQLWFDMLLGGEATSIRDLAHRVGKSRTYVTRVLRFAFVSPPVIEAALAGRTNATVQANRLLQSGGLPVTWVEQETLFGVDGH